MIFNLTCAFGKESDKMKKNIRSERGITLTVLVITVVVLSILSFTIIINMKTRSNISKL